MKKVSIDGKRYILEDFFKVEEAYLRFEQFNGEMSPRVRRLKLERGNSAAVLVLNRSTEKLLLVSQFRYPIYPNNQGWTIELIAGMVDEGETAQESARRELQEEIGVNIETFEHIPGWKLRADLFILFRGFGGTGPLQGNRWITGKR